jgi:N-acyl-D-aspartate/D-glutamate deacylase/amino acid transporter
MEQPVAPAHTLHRTLGFTDLMLIVIGTVIGSGIFIVPATVLAQTGGALGTSLLVWFLAGVLSLLGALTYGELGAANPDAGGLYVYIRDAFGTLPAFLYGWTAFFVISTGSVATLAVAFTGYLGQFFTVSPTMSKVIAVLLIVVIAAVNVRGTRQGANVQNGSTALKTLAILVMSIALLARGHGFSGTLHVWPDAWNAGVLSGVGLAMLGVLWAYEGWQYVTFSAGEARDPQRTFPRAIVVGTAVLIAIYLLANVAYVAALGPAGVQGSTRVAADSVTALFGTTAGKLIAAVILVSMFSAANGITLTAPRLYFSMARDGVFFQKLAEVHPRFRTPAFAIIAGSVWAALLAASGTFEQLLTYVVFSGWIFYGLGAMSIFVYRGRAPEMVRPFRVPGYPVTPLLFVLAAAAVVLNTLVTQPGRALLGLAVVLTGVPAYMIWRRRSQRSAAAISRQVATPVLMLVAAALGTTACAATSTATAAAPAPAAVPTSAAPAAPAGSAGAGDDSTYDVVIRNGRVLDGAGNPWIRADVGIRNGRFARIGVIHGRGRTEIDATDRYVSPGWIDMMDQSGGVLPRNPLAENKLMMGVTTAIGGEGGTPVPASEIPAYFHRLETQGISINFGSYFSETQARVPVLGMAARAPTAAELQRMRAIMDTAMRNGAMGMTTALIYPPSSYATTDELVEVARAVKPYGGIYASHIRGEGAEVVDAVHEAITVGERAGIPVEVFHLKVADQPSWGKLMNVVRDTVEAARARGVDVAADMYVYTAGGTGLEATIPSWAHEGGTDSLKKRLADPAIRARLKRELATGSPGWWNIISAAGGWNGVVLANARNPENAKYVGKSIAEIAKEAGKDPADAAWDIVAAGKGRVMAIYHMMGEQDIETALRFPWTSIGSDAGAALTAGQEDGLGLPHPRSYGNAVRVIAKYVNERQVLTLPEAVRKMTSWPATRMRLANRGIIKEGNWADVTIFDLATLKDNATYDQPTLSPSGIDWVLVNGVVVIDHGRHTGARPGQVLRGPGASAPATVSASLPQ